MAPNITANFSLLLFSNITAPSNGNSTKDNFRKGAINKTASTRNHITSSKKQLEFRITYKHLSKRNIAKQHAPINHESTKDAHRGKSKPQRRAEKITLRENRYPTSRSTHLPAKHQWTIASEERQENTSIEARSASDKTSLPDLKSNIKALSEFAANSSSLPEGLKTLANDSNNMACRTEVICKALEKEGIEQLIHSNKRSTSKESQSPHSRQKRGWFGVDEKKLAADMGPYVNNITGVLANKLQGSLVTVENMVENATAHVITTTDGFSARADKLEDMVKNATQHVMTTTNGFSAQVEGIEDMVRNATQHVISTTDGFYGRIEGIEEMVRNATQHVISTTDVFSDDALKMKNMVKNATDGTQETSSHVRKVIAESEKNLKHYLYFSGAFILASGLICLLTAGCCHCRRSRHTLELTIDKRKVTDDQQVLIDLGHQLITQSACGYSINYKISQKGNRYFIKIFDENSVIQAMLKDAFKDPLKNEEPSSTTPHLMGCDRLLPNSREAQVTTGRNKNRKMENPVPIKPDIDITIVSDSTDAANKETIL